MANWCSCMISFNDPPTNVTDRLKELIKDNSNMQLSESWITDIDSNDLEMWFSLKWGLDDQDVLDLGMKLDLRSFICTYEERGMCLAGKYQYHSEEETIDHQEILPIYWEDIGTADEEGWDIELDPYFHVNTVLAYKLNFIISDIIPTIGKSIIDILQQTSFHLKNSI